MDLAGQGLYTVIYGFILYMDRAGQGLDSI